MNTKFLAYGAVLAFLGIIAGAFGSHAVKNYISSELLQVYETAVRYQMYHSLALILVALLVAHSDEKWLVRAGWFFVAGILIFSGSLYILSLTGIRWFGAFTPFGGLAFLAGWFCVAMLAWNKK